MSRTLHVATLVLACAAFAPACLLDSSAFQNTGGSGGTGPGGGAGSGGTVGGGGSGGDTGGTTTGGGGTGGAPVVCGDGKVGSGETCDDDGTTPGDGCDGACQVEKDYACSGEPSKCEKICGDGVIKDEVETCDPGEVPQTGCTNCQIDQGYVCTGAPSVCTAACGNSAIDVNAQNSETCDDGDAEADDGCGATCTIETGWMCEGLIMSACTPICGDGLVKGNEVCDDDDLTNDNGCNALCNAITPGWTCDPGGGANSCSEICGDAMAVGDELCDDGGTISGDGCSSTCVPEHECGNGVVDPLEQCDYLGMPPGCNSDCTLVAASVCGESEVIQLGNVDAVTGVRTSFYENDTTTAGLAVTPADIPPQTCLGNMNAMSSPVLHRYTTGKRPSIVSVEALATQAGGAATFNNTLVWVYRDCPKKADIEGCDDDGAQTAKRSFFRTGYIPAHTTLFIVLSGEGGGGGGDNGKYRLQVTEQPVQLFYYNDLGMGANPGLDDNLGDLVSSSAGAADPVKWQRCIPGAGSGCAPVMGSHSGKAYAYTGDGDNNLLTNSLLQSNDIVTAKAAAKVFFQCDHRYNNVGGISDFARFEASIDSGAIFTQLVSYTTDTPPKREVFERPPSAKLRFKLTYNDNAGNVLNFSADDFYVYGY